MMRGQNLRLRDERESLKRLYFCQSLSLFGLVVLWSVSSIKARLLAAVVLIQCHLFRNPHQVLPGSDIGLWSLLVLLRHFKSFSVSPLLLNFFLF